MLPWVGLLGLEVLGAVPEGPSELFEVRVNIRFQRHLFPLVVKKG